VLAADGSSFSMPDTASNQARFPQPCRQKKGCGFPVGVFVAVVCLATGAVVDAFVGGGKMHDLAMFYYVRSCFVRGDIFLADRGFSAYAEMALFLGKGVDSVVRLHQRRLTDFRRGRVLGIGDHVVRVCPKISATSTRENRLLEKNRANPGAAVILGQTLSRSRPKYCPKGLRSEDFERLPPILPVREIRYQVTVKGFRSRQVVLATTLLDVGKYPATELADLYFQRWEIEVDFRHLKITMQMDVPRGHSPEVVEKEFWAHMLAYNLLRCLMWDAGECYGETPTKLSLKGAIQHLLPHWPPFRRKRFAEEFADLLALIAAEWLPIRPGRVEPRVRKRRPKQYTLMSKPRHELKMMLPRENF
jgi:hypothetical protein